MFLVPCARGPLDFASVELHCAWFALVLLAEGSPGMRAFCEAYYISLESLMIWEHRAIKQVVNQGRLLICHDNQAHAHERLCKATFPMPNVISLCPSTRRPRPTLYLGQWIKDKSPWGLHGIMYLHNLVVYKTQSLTGAVECHIFLSSRFWYYERGDPKGEWRRRCKPGFECEGAFLKLVHINLSIKNGVPQ